MKKVKIALVTALVLFLVGIATLIVGLAMNNWEFHPFDYSYQTDKMQIPQKIKVTSDALDVKIMSADVTEVTVEYPTSYPFKTEIRTSGDTLYCALDYRPHISFGFHSPTITILVPKEKAVDVECDIDAGRIHMEGNFASIVLDCDAGLVQLEYVTADSIKIETNAGAVVGDTIDARTIDVKTDVGGIDLTIDGKKHEYTVVTHKEVGVANVQNQTGTTDKRISISTEVGAIKLHFLAN